MKYNMQIHLFKTWIWVILQHVFINSFKMKIKMTTQI